LNIDPEAWGVLINIGDILEISGRPHEALSYLERAYAAMERGYARNPVQIRPWHAQLGAAIARRHAAEGDPSTAESWYRRVLAKSPLHPDATRGLAQLLRQGGDTAEAARLCAELESRVGQDVACGTGEPRNDPD
jgi:Flp pilus assembly protein TadD